MAYGPPRCACCGDEQGVEKHHLYARAEGCPDDLTVWLCHGCHGRAHPMTRGNRTNRAVAAALGREAVQRRATEFAKNVLPVIREVQGRGIRTYAAIAAELNRRGVKTSLGLSWRPPSVRNLLRRVGA
jgi:hypothetical protein